MNPKTLLFLLIAACLLSACAEEVAPTDYPIEDGVTITIGEYNPFPRPSDPQLYLTMRTQDSSYHCSNSPIVSAHAFKGNILDIEVFGVNDPEGACAFLGGPAIKTFDLDESVSNILVKFGNKRDRYRIRINEERVEIEPVSTSFSYNLSDSYLRVPRNSFRCVCSTPKDEPDTCEDFISLLLSNLNIEEHRFPNGTSPFNRDSETQTRIHLTRQFVYSNPDAFEGAKELLVNFAPNINSSNGGSIRLEDWRGERFHHWEN